jgi:oxygen-independent coproporphyrinogen-3 oxidase
MINSVNNEKAPRKLGLYIHIPFCRTKCLYCDFCSFVSREVGEREKYVNALLREIEERSAKEYSVDTIYFGGGTPSLLSVDQIERILLAVRENFTLCDDAEITLECNPMTHLDDGKEYFSSLRALRVNRLSLGIQSAVDSELKLIGRRHTFEEAKKTIFDAREAGFDNVSVDLMFGIPSQTLESLSYSVHEFLLLGAEHISIYSLQLEEGTPLYRMRQKYELADDDTAADMYESVSSLMRRAGYFHYEISNFAKEGRESRHNSKYWRLFEYLGLGLSAHSDFCEERSENTRDLERYLAGEYRLCGEKIGELEREAEFIMLGLRLSEGISKSEFLARFGVDFDEKYGEKIKMIEKLGYFSQNGQNLALNERGFEVSNMILAQILDFDY